MREAGIHPGDMVLVEKGGRPKPNDIVIAQVDDDWTLKYYGKDSEGVYLDPANSKFKRIRPRQSLTIGGIVRAVIRQYECFEPVGVVVDVGDGFVAGQGQSGAVAVLVVGIINHREHRGCDG
jgi:hypothetical protein